MTWCQFISPPVSYNHIQGVMALTLFEDFVYWTDGKSKSLRRVHKTTGDQGMELLNSWQAIKSIKVYHSLRQPEGITYILSSHGGLWLVGTVVLWSHARRPFSTVPKHQCQVANGGCSHLCLLSPGGEHKCACPSNFYLAADNKTCLSNCTSSQVSNILILSPVVAFFPRRMHSSNWGHVIWLCINSWWSEELWCTNYNVCTCSSAVAQMSVSLSGGSVTQSMTVGMDPMNPQTVVSTKMWH